MAKIESPGFCSHECDIDAYNRNVNEFNLMAEVAEVDPAPGRDHSKRVGIMKLIGAYQANIVEDCQREATEMPCEGYVEEGVALNFGQGTSDMIVHCPVLVRHFAGAVK